MNQMPATFQPVVRLPLGLLEGEPIRLTDYQKAALYTDRMPVKGHDPLLGLFGEVGSLLSELKKKRRDKASYFRYETAVLEEFGDVLWYLAVIADRAGLSLSEIAQRALRTIDDWDEIDKKSCTFLDIQTGLKKSGIVSESELMKRLIELATKAGGLVSDSSRIASNRDALSAHLVDILRAIIEAANESNISLNSAAYRNLQKSFSRWPLKKVYPPSLNKTEFENEWFPGEMTVHFREYNVKQKTYVIQKCNGINIGDRLTDNKRDPDDYRFHDVFHLAFATYLGWSPVLRALLKIKRKSNPVLDDGEDGARAILIEEGVSTFIFGRGIASSLFVNQKSVDYDLLKSIQSFIEGYEVQVCALWQWEEAILNGFKVFRQLKKYRQGYVVADIKNHKLTFMRGRRSDA